MHVADDEALAHVPAGQGVHVAAPAPEKVPGKHATQLAELVAPSVLEAVPAAQGVQLAWPLAVE